MGVRTIFGYSGDGINYSGDGINGIREVFTGPETVLSTSRPRHEEMAAFMAGGFAKFTNEDIPGVCLATSGPGAIHLLNGLYDAKDGSPAGGAIVGQTSRMSLGATYQP